VWAFLSLESLSSDQQCLQVIRGWASVSRIIFFGPAVPSSYSRLGFGPSNCLFRLSNTFKLFEAALRSLELSFSGQQCLQVIRGWASVPRIIFFGPAVPSSYSRLGFGPSNCVFRLSNAFKLFEAGLRSLELSFSGQQCLQVIRGCSSSSRIIFFGSAMPSKCSSLNYGSSKHIPRPPASSFCSRMG
jgi:hypothetical protein